MDITSGNIAATLIGAVCVVGVVGLLVKRQKRGTDTVNWSPLEAVTITLAIYFLTQLLAAFGVSLAGSWLGYTGEQLSEAVNSSSYWQFGYVLLVDAISIGILYWFLKRRSTPWRAIGWVRPKLRDIGYALSGYAVYFVVYAFAVMPLLKYIPGLDTDQKQELGFNTAVVGPELFVIFLSLVILPPLIEEILVRGFLFTGLRNKLPVVVAAIAASLVFGLAHLQWGSGKPLLWIAAIDTFVLSLILIWVRVKTGSLWPGIGVHFIKNGIAFMLLFVFKVV